MILRSWTAAAVIVLMSVLCGCTSTSGGERPATTPAAGTTSPSQQVSTSTSDARTSASHHPVPSLTSRLAKAGVVCPAPPSATGNGTACTFRGEKVKVSTSSWTAEAGLRKQACSDGYINKSYLVATDEQNLSMYPSFNSTARKLARALSLRVVPYCS